MKRACVLAVVALGMWALKRHYAEAGADALDWILAPVARAVGAITGATFEHEAGAGYLCRERWFAIEKACAGINFMIAALGMLGFVLSRRATSWTRAACVVASSAVLSYVAALIVNVLRIVVAMKVVSWHMRSAWFDAAALHRLEGIVVYFGALLGLHAIVRRFVADREVAT